MGGVDAVEFEVFESISHYGLCRLSGITVSPERHTNPIAKFCASVVIGMKADAAAQATLFAEPDQQPKFVVLGGAGYIFSRMPLLVWVRDAKRGRCDFARSD